MLAGTNKETTTMGAFVSVICFKTVVLSARKQMLMNPCSFASSIGRTPRLTNIFYQYECGIDFVDNLKQAAKKLPAY